MANLDDMEELVFENVVKMKYVIDCIVNKEYEEWYKREEWHPLIEWCLMFLLDG